MSSFSSRNLFKAIAMICLLLFFCFQSPAEARSLMRSRVMVDVDLMLQSLQKGSGGSSQASGCSNVSGNDGGPCPDTGG
ncbi:hypothetical protein MUK42_08301 [Musa troglodytarum]|uniref:Transmembrane protein n=1 Tax=Musa troglodytarum TaxID=320322 RepID=A0A9E7LG10_9LILI|nr:hypothetical protein MUK42_08301 [Musa troglodytarum]